MATDVVVTAARAAKGAEVLAAQRLLAALVVVMQGIAWSVQAPDKDVGNMPAQDVLYKVEAESSISDDFRCFPRRR